MNGAGYRIAKNTIPDAKGVVSNYVWSVVLFSKNNMAQNSIPVIFVIKKQKFILKLTLPPKPSLAAGFTLVELLITISVFLLLLIVAAPSYQTMIMNNRMTANADSLVNSLNYARSTALYETVNVVVCPLGAVNSTSCGTDWSNGWIVVTQPVTGSGTLLKSQQLSPSEPVLSSTTASVVFDTHGIATAQTNFKLCDTRGSSFARSLQVFATGLVQAGNTPGRAVWDNSALACP